MADGLSGRLVAHVPMPFSTPGNTLLEVVDELARVHSARGGESLALLSDNRGLSTRNARDVYVDHTSVCPRQYFTRTQTAVDALAGSLGRTRPSYGRLHDPSIAAAREHDAQVVILYEGHYAAASLAHWNRLRPRVRVVLYVHNPLSRTYRRRELQTMASMSDAWVFCADHLRREALERLGPTRTPLITIPNGIDPSFFSPAPTEHHGNEFTVLFVGRTAEHKGPHHLLEALEPAQSMTLHRLRAIIIGSDNYGLGGELTEFERQLRQRAGELSVPVTFIPHVDRTEVVRQMRDASLICIPSVWPEGLPLVALEALASRAPVVAFRSAGVMEACKDAALYADVGDAGQLASLIAQAANDPASTHRRVELGYEIATAHTWEQTWAEFIRLAEGW